MENPMEKFRQSSIVFKKPGILSENLKTLTIFNYPTVPLFFLLKLSTLPKLPYLPMFTKRCVGFFLFCLDLELLVKNKKDLVSTHSFFRFLLITQDLNKIKKIPNTLF